MRIFFNSVQTKSNVNLLPQVTSQSKIISSQHLDNDVVEFSFKSRSEFVLPAKFEYTPTEELAKGILSKIKKLTLDINTQKYNLKYYYSAQDKYDYQELLKTRRNLKSQFNRLSKNNGYSPELLKDIIDEKDQYNFYVPKILRTKSLNDLHKVQELIESKPISFSIRSLLNEHIENQKKLLSAKK